MSLPRGFRVHYSEMKIVGFMGRRGMYMCKGGLEESLGGCGLLKGRDRTEYTS